MATTDKNFKVKNGLDAAGSITGLDYKIGQNTVLSSSQVLGKNVPTGDIVGSSDSQTLTNKTFSAELPSINETITILTNGTNSTTSSSWCYMFGSSSKGTGTIVISVPVASNIPGYVSGTLISETKQINGSTLTISGSGSSDFYGTYTVTNVFKKCNNHIIIYATNPNLLNSVAPAQQFTLNFTKSITTVTASMSDLVKATDPDATNDVLYNLATSALPALPGNQGKVLHTSGTTTSWKLPFAAVNSSNPASPSDGDIYFNYSNLTLNVAYGGSWFIIGQAQFDGGEPSTTSFEEIYDGGSPDTTVFGATADAGALN